MSRWHPVGMTPQVGGYRLGADRSAPRLILLPGIEGDARVFAGQVALAARRPVAALHLPDAHTIPEAAAQAAASLPNRPVVIVGVSLGGLVGWCLTLTDPRVVGLITLGTLPSPGLAPARIAPARRLLRHLPPPLVATLYRRRIARRMIEEGVDPMMRQALLGSLPDRDVLCRRLAAVCTWQPPAPPPCPTLWLRGQVDQEISWDGATIRRHLPGVGIEVVPGGHRAHLTHPRPLNDTIEQFLRSL